MGDRRDASESLTEETRGLVASARALVAEWVEEGVDRFDGATPADPPREPEVDARRPIPTPVATQLSLDGDAQPWPARPTLEQVREVLGECTCCGLCERRNQIVFGQGDPNAELMFIGEGPGEQEDLLAARTHITQLRLSPR